jgi:hypothetical protein
MLAATQGDTTMRMIRPAERVCRSWTADSGQWDAKGPREDDIFITSAPKCGTTWMQQNASSFLFQDVSTDDNDMRGY